MAGQSVGLVNKILPLKDVLNNLIKEAQEELKRVRNFLGMKENEKQN